jgi:hypothetical protein
MKLERGGLVTREVFTEVPPRMESQRRVPLNAYTTTGAPAVSALAFQKTRTMQWMMTILKPNFPLANGYVLRAQTRPGLEAGQFRVWIQRPQPRK